jgi:hypothetical protein
MNVESDYSNLKFEDTPYGRTILFNFFHKPILNNTTLFLCAFKLYAIRLFK